MDDVVDAPEPAPPPALKTCWIDRLPTETKAKIAKYCYEQDLVLDDFVVVRYRPRDLACRETLSTFRKQLPTTSLGALFRVSKSWSEICAPLHFKEIRHAEQLDDRSRLDILRSRVDFFTKAHVGSPDGYAWLALVEALPSLRNLRTLSFDSTSADRLLEFWDDEHAERGNIAQEDAAHLEHIRQAVRELLARCDMIELHDNWGRLDALLDSSISSEHYQATRLRLHAGEIDATAGVHQLPARFPHLRSLHIKADQFRALPFDTFAPFDRLTSLSLCAEPGKVLPTLSVFADAHSANLVTLTIQVNGGMGLFGLGGEERAVFFPFKSEYPYLRRLNIKPEDAVRSYEGEELLASITPERFPSLAVLECTNFAAAENVKSYPSSFTDLLARPAFRLVLTPTPISSRPSLVDYARTDAPNFNKDASRRIEDGVVVDCDLDAEDEADFADGGPYCVELEETAEFLARAIRQARVSGDTAALKRLAVAVKGVVMEKRLMEA